MAERQATGTDAWLLTEGMSRHIPAHDAGDPAALVNDDSNTFG